MSNSWDNAVCGSWDRAPGRGGASLLAALLILLLWASDARAVDEAPFRVTGVDGEVELRYLYDGYDSKSRRLKSVGIDETIYELETGVTVDGYVYHPNFLHTTLGGSTVYVRNVLDEALGDYSSDDWLFNFRSRFNFLEKKPYPITLYYERENPSIYPGLVERLEQVNHRAGLQFNVHRPVLPAELSFNVDRARYNGGNSFQIVKEEDNRTDLNLSRIFSDQHRASMQFERDERTSQSGRRDMPITLVDQTIDKVNLDSRHVFGSRGQIHISNYISQNKQSGSFSHDIVRFAPFMTWTHNDRVQTSYRYSLTDSTQQDIDSTSKIVKASIRYRPVTTLETNYEFYKSRDDTTGLSTERVGNSGRVLWRHDVDNGQMVLSANVALETSDRSAFTRNVPVVGELVVLAGIDSAPLSEERIYASSIVVRNASRTQTYVDELDYRVVVIGTRTEIQRLAGGNILDGEEVVIDYQYDSAGSLGFRTLNQTYQANWSLFDYLQVRLHYRNSHQNVTSGNPIFKLNSIENWLLGVRVHDYEISDEIQVGASGELESQREDITPFDRYGLSSYVLFQLPHATYLRLAADYTNVNNHGSVEDVDRAGLRLLLRSRPWRYTLLSAEMSRDVDVGGTLDRKITSALVNLNWRVRKLSLDANLRYSVEEQGSYRRGRTSVHATLTRDI